MDILKYVMLALTGLALAVSIDGGVHDWMVRQDVVRAQQMVAQAQGMHQQAQAQMQQAQAEAQKEKAQFNECMEQVASGKFKTLEDCQKAEAAVPPKPGKG